MKVAAPAISPSWVTLESEPLRLHNLLNDLSTLQQLAMSELTAAARAARAAGSAAAAGAVPSPPALRLVGAHLLDAYLLTAGVAQIVDDYLHRDVMGLKKAGRYLKRLPSPLGPMMRQATAHLRAAGYYGRAQLPPTRRLATWRAELGRLVEDLASLVVVADETGPSAGEAWLAAADGEDLGTRLDRLTQLGERVLTATTWMPAPLRQSVVRLPTCFRSFDQRPADCGQLVRLFQQQQPNRDAPVTVIGLRTSGSYLAPLCAAYLRALGYRHVAALTMRPGQHWFRAERDVVVGTCQAHGQILLVDDPPSTGGSLADSAHDLERIGVQRAAITLLLPLFGTRDVVPNVLRPYRALCLPRREWAVYHELTEDAVREALTEFLVGNTVRVATEDSSTAEVTVKSVERVERIPLDPPHDDHKAIPHVRGHARALYRVDLVEWETGRRFTHSIYVKGAGLGYFGAYSLAVASAVERFVPRIYGYRHGLTYRAWAPEDQRLQRYLVGDTDRASTLAATAGRLAEYVAHRRRALAVADDPSLRLTGRNPVWQRASDLLGQAFGHAAPLIRPALHWAGRRLLLRALSWPSVVDGSMAPAQWFLREPATAHAANPATSLVKVNFDERAFNNEDLYCFDAAFDLATAAAYYDLSTEEGIAFSRLVREQYALRTGDDISEERWQLYQLICLLSDRDLLRWAQGLSGQSGRQTDPDSSDAESAGQVESLLRAVASTDRALARIHASYLGARYLGDLSPASSGSLCAIDIDGVFESAWLSFMSTTPAGALALRALTVHGYRPVLATGRCLDEVREKCQAYRLAGGVAEYGAVAYNARTNRAHVLLSDLEQRHLDGLRAALAQVDGVHVDPTYRFAVRAFRLDQHGERAGLAPHHIAGAMASVPDSPAVRVIPGFGQTDFMVERVDKGTGLTALAGILGDHRPHSVDEPLLALAVGDTISDLPMFRLAKYAVAPSNADAALRQPPVAGTIPIHFAKRPYQAGVLEGVSRLLGHNPYRCAQCQPPRGSEDALLLQRILAAQDVGKWGKAWYGLRLIAMAGRDGLHQGSGFKR